MLLTEYQPARRRYREAQEDLNAVSAALYDDAPAGDVEASARAGEVGRGSAAGLA